MSEIFLGTNAIAALVGWIAFNFIVLSTYKDDNEKTFNFKAYYLEHWDNWFGSLFSIPAFLWLGSKGFNFHEIGAEGLKWSDAYYVASGFAFESVKIAWKKWKSKNS